MKIGFNEATAMGCSDLETDLVLCEKAGFDFIEIRLDKLGEYLKTHTIDSLRSFFENSTVKPHALNALYTYSGLCAEDSEQNRKVISEFIQACKYAQAIGAGYIVVVPPLQRDPNGGPFEGSPGQVHKDCVRILRCLGKKAEEYGIGICFEVVGFNRSSVRSVNAAAAILDEVMLPNAGLVIDAYNLYMHRGHDSFEEIKSVSTDKIFAVHINNADYAPQNEMGQHLRRFCDGGIMDLSLFLKELKHKGYDGMVSIETFRPEYWQASPGWVIKTAFETTYNCLRENGCL